jgi:hypothetical protein
MHHDGRRGIRRLHLGVTLLMLCAFAAIAAATTPSARRQHRASLFDQRHLDAGRSHGLLV